MSITVNPVSGPVRNARLAFGQRASQSLIMLMSVVTALNPCCVSGCLPGWSPP